MASMDVEAIAVIKKNSKNNNTQGCTKAFCSHYEFLFLSAVIKNVQVVRGLRKGKDQGRVVQGNIVADQSNKS